ncbi:MAG: STAS domain-containing protein [Chitinophagaceae bacterium]|nr:STAS domain-containing protein [Bacteroidota bacterium]MCC6256734.1 STAS domain-containing protein [Chitinophagaceae bacterium]
MNVKLSTKEKFVVLEVLEANLSAIMSEPLSKIFQQIMGGIPPHLVLDLGIVKQIDEEIAFSVASWQSRFYERQYSFVICSMREEVAQVFRSLDLFDNMNTTPTLSEAWDMVQMEEIERELLNDFNDNEA